MVHHTITDTNGFSEKDLVLRAQSGDSNAITEIVTAYTDKVYNYSLRMLHNKEDAEDVLQETFLSVIKNIKTFEGRSRLSTWIYRIATNAALMKLRSRKRVFETLDDTIDLSRDYESVNKKLSQSPFEIVQNKEIAEKIMSHLEDLTPNHRSVFILRDIENFSTQEVADMLKMSVPAVKTNLMRARIALRDKLADELLAQ